MGLQNLQRAADCRVLPDTRKDRLGQPESQTRQATWAMRVIGRVEYMTLSVCVRSSCTEYGAGLTSRPTRTPGFGLVALVVLRTRVANHPSRKAQGAAGLTSTSGLVGPSSCTQLCDAATDQAITPYSVRQW